MNITFLIGNGFDRALDGALIKEKPFSVGNTSYKGIYTFLEHFEFLQQPLSNTKVLGDNVFIQDLIKTYDSTKNTYSDYEKLMVEEFSHVQSPADLKELCNDKDQAVCYIKEIFYFWGSKFYDNNNDLLNLVYPEFENSICNLFDRIDIGNRNTLTNSMANALNDSEIEIEFITFNGTDVLQSLVDILSNKKNLSITIDNKQYNLKIVPKVKYVHSNVHSSDYIAKAFGTTDEKLVGSFGLPDSIKHTLLKTNTDFETWIAKSDMLVIHGLSLGESDIRYLEWIINQVVNNTILLDCPLCSTNPVVRKKQLIGSNTNSIVNNNIIVATTSTKTSTNGGAIIFDF